MVFLKWGAVKNLEFVVSQQSHPEGCGQRRWEIPERFQVKLFRSARLGDIGCSLCGDTTDASRIGYGAMAHWCNSCKQDFGKHHFDVNEGVQFVGDNQLGGFDRRFHRALLFHP